MPPFHPPLWIPQQWGAGVARPIVVDAAEGRLHSGGWKGGKHSHTAYPQRFTYNILYIYIYIYIYIFSRGEDTTTASHQGSTCTRAGRCRHTCNYLGGNLRGTGTVACMLAPSFFPPMGNLLERIGPRQIRFTRAVQFPREMYVSCSAIFLLWASAISCQSCTAVLSSAVILRFLLMSGFCGSRFGLRPLLCTMGSLSFRWRRQQYHLHPQGHTQSLTLVCLLQ